jgi:predicted O-methyltransferase YrrM
LFKYILKQKRLNKKGGILANTVNNPKNYFAGLMPERDEILRQLETEAQKENIPIVGPVVGQLLFVLARAKGAANILELGTATGYSAIYLGRACAPAGGKVTTIENDPEMAERARKNISSAGLGQTISVIESNALKILPRLRDFFDFVFMDIEKKDYNTALSLVTPLSKPGCLLIADNTAFADAVGFNQAISNSKAWDSVQLFSYLPMHSAINDGLCFGVRTRQL